MTQAELRCAGGLMPAAGSGSTAARTGGREMSVIGRVFSSRERESDSGSSLQMDKSGYTNESVPGMKLLRRTIVKRTKYC